MPSSGLIRQVPRSDLDLSVLAPDTFGPDYRWFSPRSQENAGSQPTNQTLLMMAWLLPRRVRVDGLACEFTGGTPNQDVHMGIYDSVRRGREAQIVPNNLRVGSTLTGVTTTGIKADLFAPITLTPGTYFTACLPVGTTMGTMRTVFTTRGGNPWQFLWAGNGGTGGTPSFAAGNDPMGVWSLASQSSLPPNASAANSVGNGNNQNIGLWMSMRISWA